MTSRSNNPNTVAAHRTSRLLFESGHQTDLRTLHLARAPIWRGVEGAPEKAGSISPLSGAFQWMTGKLPSRGEDPYTYGPTTG